MSNNGLPTEVTQEELDTCAETLERSPAHSTQILRHVLHCKIIPENLAESAEVAPASDANSGAAPPSSDSDKTEAELRAKARLLDDAIESLPRHTEQLMFLQDWLLVARAFLADGAFSEAQVVLTCAEEALQQQFRESKSHQPDAEPN
ncbi:MAG: hypothetical protein MI861_20015 [Pirellulales bacterium]|nr:hypothetical protein [Pirellulales bacterium]